MRTGPAGEVGRVLPGPEITRFVGAHDGLTARLAEEAGFDALWAGGLGICSTYGLPDSGILTATEFLNAAITMRRVSRLPILADCDAGFGDRNVVARIARDYAAAGIDAICIEDKQYPKRNSFWSGNMLADPGEFAEKVSAAGDVAGLVVVARLEGFIAGAPLEDSLKRAKLYTQAGAHAVLVHSRSSLDAEVAAFCRAWDRDGSGEPVIVIPTTYHTYTAADLAGIGASGVIYANQLLRACLAAARDALSVLRSDDRTTRLEARIATLDDVFSLCSVDASPEDRASQKAIRIS